MQLEEYGEPIAFEIAFWMQGLNDPQYPIAELGNLSLDISNRLRSLAIMALLVQGDSDLFYHNLIRSAKAREMYLRRLKERGIEQDHHRASGRYAGLVDGIAGGDFEVVRNIVELSPRDWQQGHEYEDDYCYAQILHRFVQVTPDLHEIDFVLKQFETYQDGQASARLDLCRALEGPNQEAFDLAFDALIEEQDAAIAADVERCQLEEPEVIAQRNVFVEGLAVLRLATLRGLVTEQEYKYCPSLARIPMVRPFPGE